jgi:hypothetical protein
MQRHITVSLPCQYCGKPERRVRWREGNLVTCFACNTLRRNDRAKLRRAAEVSLEQGRQTAS